MGKGRRIIGRDERIYLRKVIRDRSGIALSARFLKQVIHILFAYSAMLSPGSLRSAESQNAYRSRSLPDDHAEKKRSVFSRTYHVLR
jgi:hypothetical protein